MKKGLFYSISFQCVNFASTTYFYLIKIILPFSFHCMWVLNNKMKWKIAMDLTLKIQIGLRVSIRLWTQKYNGIIHAKEIIASMYLKYCMREKYKSFQLEFLMCGSLLVIYRAMIKILIRIYSKSRNITQQKFYRFIQFKMVLCFLFCERN